MFKNIYTKFVVIYLTLLILIVILLSAFSIGFFYKQYSEEAQIQSLAMADKIDGLLTQYYNNEITKKELTSWIDAMSYVASTKIYVLNPDKTVINNASNQDQIFTNEDVYEDITKVMEGNVVIKMGLLTQKTDNNIMYMGKPFVYNGEIAGIILLFTPVEQFAKTIETMLYGIVSISILITIIGSIVILLVSKNISRPITQISDYARKIGKGQEVEDLEIVGQDEIANLAKSFNEMKREIKASEEIRKEFVANVSHELRTPLTTIIGFLKGILDGVIRKEEQNKYIQIAYDEANRLKTLTADILDATKLEAGRIMLNKTKFSLSDLLDDVYMEFNQEVKNKGLELCTEYRKTLILEGDRDRIKQVIINVVSNALKFTQKGYIKISAKYANQHMIITVEDTGIGISEEKIPHIFDKFYTANKYGSATGGAGLGLNIAENIVKLHGGKITVQSKINEGTIITIEI